MIVKNSPKTEGVCDKRGPEFIHDVALQCSSFMLALILSIFEIITPSCVGLYQSKWTEKTFT